MKLPERPEDWVKILQKEGIDMFKLLSDRQLFTKATEFNRRYLYWNELVYRVSDKTEQRYLWTFMKFMRSEKYEKIPFKPLDLKYVHLPQIIKHLYRFDTFLGGNITIQGKSLGLQKRYIISSLMEEAIASIMLEGAVTTRKAAKEMLRQRRRPKDTDEQMVLNGYETIQMIVKRKGEKLTPEFLSEIQTTITKGTLKDATDVGKFRDDDNIVVGDDDDPDLVYHTPPDHKKVAELVAALCEFANSSDAEFIHPIIKGIILHFLIGYIHPFNDGNGRTARSIFYWYVLSQGYWLFEYMAVSRRILRSKKQYGLSYIYTEYDEFDLTYFIRYNLEAIDDALNDLLAYIEVKQQEQEEAQKLIGSIRDLNFRQGAILEEMMKNKERSYALQEISEVYHVVYETARTDMSRLHALGYVTMERAAKKMFFRFNPGKEDDL